MRRTYLMLVVIFVLALSVTIPALMAADPGGVQPLNPKFAAYGKTYSEWSADWWQWVYSIPVASNPLVDNGDCSVGQSGPVWFLGGKFYILVPDAPAGRNAPATATVVRNCSVPIGTALFFPVGNISVTAPEEPDWGCGNSLPPLVSGTIAEMRQCISLYLTTTGLAAEIDGHAIPNIEKYRVQSPEFTVTFPEDNLLTALGEGPFPAGTYSPTVADGFYLLLPPLSPGHHTLHIQQGAAQSITYNLTIY